MPNHSDAATSFLTNSKNQNDDDASSVCDAFDLSMMRLALEQAQQAEAQGDVPVGAVLVCDKKIVARAYNRREQDQDPVAHAEILCLRQAAQKLGHWRLSGCTLYVSLEPCPMCAGALIHARVDRLVFATNDPRTGACGSIMNTVQDPRLNHRVELCSGLLKDEAQTMLQDFFRGRRNAKKTKKRPPRTRP